MKEEDHHAICTAMLSLLLPLFFFFFLAPHLFLKLCACIALLSPVLGFVSLVLDSAFVTFIVLLYWICCCCCSCFISSSGIGVIASRKRMTGRIEFNAATTTRIITNSLVCSPRAYLYLEIVIGREKWYCNLENTKQKRKTKKESLQLLKMPHTIGRWSS